MATEKQLAFLDNLRDSGVTNMLGATPYLIEEFNLETKEARAVLFKWMDTFADRHPVSGA